jgi:hypothetical protein
MSEEGRVEREKIKGGISPKVVLNTLRLYGKTQAIRARRGGEMG